MTANYLERYSALLYSCNAKLFVLYASLMNNIKPLQTTVDVIEALGGDDIVRALTKCSPQTLWNWKNYGQFPSKTFVMMSAALAMKGLVAPASLWGMQQAVAAE